MFKQFYCSSFHHQDPTRWQPIDAEGHFAWSSQSAMLGERVVFVFEEARAVSEITVPCLWTDVTTDGFMAAIYLQTKDNVWPCVGETTQNVTYETLSDITPKTGFVPAQKTLHEPWTLRLPEPMVAGALAMVFQGHGWFGMRRLPEIQGDVVADNIPAPVFQGGAVFTL